jgi:hypothetical protein
VTDAVVAAAAESVAATAEDFKFEFYAGDNYLALPRDPQPWIIKGLVPANALMNIHGAPKAGKSYFALQLACAISDPQQQEFLDFRVHSHGPVLYLQVDTPREIWAERIENIKKEGLNINGVHFTDANLVPYPCSLDVRPIMEALRAKLAELRPVALVLDTLREVHEQDEDSSTEMKKVISSLVQIVKPTHTTLILISHSRKEFNMAGKKGGGKPPDDVINDNRGSGYVAGRMDMVAKLTQKTLMLKGRSIMDAKVPIERNKIGMVLTDSTKQESQQHLEAVMKMDHVPSDRKRADLLAALEGIEPAAARERIKKWRKHNGSAATGSSDSGTHQEGEEG